MLSWMQRGVQTMLDVFWRTSTFFEKERRWTYGLGYNVVFTAALQLIVTLVLAGFLISQGQGMEWFLLSSAMLEPVYIAFATLLWSSFIALSLALWRENSFILPSSLIASLIGVTIIVTVLLNVVGVDNPVWRGIGVFGSWFLWVVVSYVWLWYHSSWFEDVLSISQYSWLASYPYIVVSGGIVLLRQGFGLISTVWLEVVSSLVGAAAIVHIVVASVYGLRERFDLSLLGAALAGIIGPLLIFLTILVVIYAGVLLT